MHIIVAFFRAPVIHDDSNIFQYYVVNISLNVCCDNLFESSRWENVNKLSHHYGWSRNKEVRICYKKVSVAMVFMRGNPTHFHVPEIYCLKCKNDSSLLYFKRNEPNI